MTWRQFLAYIFNIPWSLIVLTRIMTSDSAELNLKGCFALASGTILVGFTFFDSISPFALKHALAVVWSYMYFKPRGEFAGSRNYDMHKSWAHVSLIIQGSLRLVPTVVLWDAAFCCESLPPICWHRLVSEMFVNPSTYACQLIELYTT